MSTIKPAGRFWPTFFFWLALVMCFFVFGGFGIHSLIPALRGDFPPAPPIVHLHGLVFVSWMLLLLAQTALVGAGQVKLHRSLGLWGIAHATAIMILGLLMQLIASRAGMDAGRSPAGEGLYLGLWAVTGFPIMFTLAIRNRQRPQVHKRMVMFAMLPVIPPGVNRFWSNLLGLADPIPSFWLYLTLWTMAAAILLHERRETGRISRYSLFGTAWVVVEGTLHETVLASETYEQFARALLGLVHYR